MKKILRHDDIIVNNSNDWAIVMYEDDGCPIVELFHNNAMIEKYDCEDRIEANLTFHTIRDTLKNVQKFSL